MKILRPGIARDDRQGRGAALRARGPRRARCIPTGDRLRAARGGGRIREDHRRRARPAARGGEREPAAAQLRRRAPAHRARGVLGLVQPRRDGDGAHRRHPGERRRADPRGTASTSRSSRANGVEIFFTQVFRDGFFHADMHPGNIFVARDGRYCGVDFGIMGTLSDADKNYLAMNFIAFFNRDYQRGGAWRTSRRAGCRADTRRGRVRGRDPLGVRADLRPAAEGHLLRQAADAPLRGRRGASAWTIQPQLVLLQKTLLQVEGLGPPARSRARPAARRAADPRALDERAGGLRAGSLRQMRDEAPLWARTLPQLPRLVHRMLSDDGSGRRIERALVAPRSACSSARRRRSSAGRGAGAPGRGGAPALAWRAAKRARGMLNIPH